MDTISQANGQIKRTPEELYQIYQECNVPGTPIKLVLQRHGLKPWDLSALRKKAREALLFAFAGNLHARKKTNGMVPLREHQMVLRELDAAKDALAAVGHELALSRKFLTRLRRARHDFLVLQP